jgi:hypothetical protein
MPQPHPAARLVDQVDGLVGQEPARAGDDACCAACKAGATEEQELQLQSCPWSIISALQKLTEMVTRSSYKGWRSFAECRACRRHTLAKPAEQETGEWPPVGDVLVAVLGGGVKRLISVPQLVVRLVPLPQPQQDLVCLVHCWLWHVHWLEPPVSQKCV